MVVYSSAACRSRSMQDSDLNRIKVDYQPRDSASRRTLFSTRNRFIDRGNILPEEMGTGKVRFEQDENGLGYGELQTEGARDRFEFRVALEKECFKIPFLLSRDATLVGIEGTRDPVSLTPTVSFLLSPSSIGTAVVPAEVPLHLISFFVPPERLQAVLDELEARPSAGLRRSIFTSQGDPYLHNGIVTPALRTVVDQIRHCQMRGSLRHLYLEGKLLELTALRIQEICDDPGPSGSAHTVHFTNRDREKIREATEIIAGSMQDPPTIYKLSRLVGLNTTKLKKGFRSELGITVFEYVYRLRMEQALVLLRDTDMNVTEVAWEVGYSNPSAFSAAFKRDFGCSPSDVLKGRR